MPVIEAMSTATPVIGTNVGGLKETIEHEVTGVLVEPNDDLTLANSLVKLLTDDKKRERMGYEARKRMIAKYSWECISNTLNDFYDELF
jgi:glycosyltransferase involved in cell wall biosynthesis